MVVMFGKHISQKRSCLSLFACRTGQAFVTLQVDSAVLHLGCETTDLTLSLSKLTDTEVKCLLFKMADSLTHLENGADTSSFSPINSPQNRTNVFEPRIQHKDPTVAVRKHLPGASLINPGSKKANTFTVPGQI
ncbi:protein PAXX-like [Myxocyprinus asiaticus]|uniref:protein PAXX-like n=1 Tax=Myxocyprinus asiaticus TaxID=70543 RepID=UPI0022223A63|nr:protein PAXX-like [Myxocyprinus asiaticus]